MRKIQWPIAGASTLLIAVAGAPNVGFAQTAVRKAMLPLSFLQRSLPRTARSGESFTKMGAKKNPGGRSALNVSRLSGIDSVAYWTDQFIAPGFDASGSPQSVWPFSMVGSAPESGRKTTIGAPIVPVTLDLLGPDGRVANPTGMPLTFAPDPGLARTVVNSPVFQPWTYTSGTGQFNDQMMRAQFWNRIGHRDHDDHDHDHADDDDGWHVLLAPKIRAPRRMQIPFGSWFSVVDPAGRPVAAIVDADVFANALFPESLPIDATTPIGAAELAGDITTRDISTFLFNNVFLYVGGDPNACCILGFHDYDFEPGDEKNGNRERRYVVNYASWISNGLLSGGFEDITALSHEMSEIFDDPFVDNATPWWLSSDPFSGAQLCQAELESGDVLEVLSSNLVFPISMHGRTYHPQNEALFPWFAFQSPSPANLGAYSFPDETTLTSLSPGPLLPGCIPAP